MNKNKDLFFEVIRTLVGVGIALALALIIIVSVSDEPANALKQFLLMPAASLTNIGNIIEMSIPFIFTGIAVCVMYQAHQFTMIGEGAFFIGGVAASAVAIGVALPMGLHPLACILFGGVAGAVAGWLIGLFKAKWGASEFVMSLMLNNVLLYVGMLILRYFLRDPKKGTLSSFAYPASAKLPVLIPHTRIHAGVIIALVLVVLTYLFLYRTKWGYAIRVTGFNQDFAKYSGIATSTVIIYSQLVGGFLAGVGGGVEVLGMYTRFQWNALPGYGFDGILVATLARLNPLLVPFGAIFLAYIRVGADIMGRNSDVPNEVVSIIQAVIIVLVAASGFLSTWKHRRTLKRTAQAASQAAAVEGGQKA